MRAHRVHVLVDVKIYLQKSRFGNGRPLDYLVVSNHVADDESVAVSLVAS